MPPKIDSMTHQRRVRWMLGETIIVFLVLSAASVAWTLSKTTLDHTLYWAGVVLLTILQGGWFHRLYTAAHEAIHKKLVPDNRRLNDIIGQALLSPLLIPVPVYRKIHQFHHTHNRRDHHTSTLDGFVVTKEPGFFKRVYLGLCWYIGVFAGGYFLHGVVSILFFLFLPPAVAQKVSPAFKGWRWRDQFEAMAIFAGCVGLHAGLAWAAGASVWWAVLGRPFLFFAWIYSLFVYIYHYRTTYGDQVVYHVRSVPTPRFFKWWLLNFSHHRVHHRYPTLPWHMLPEEPAELPEAFKKNENVDTLLGAVLQQAKGPEIFVEPEKKTS